MANQHVILPDLRLAVVTFSGAVRGAELSAATRAVYADPAWRPGFQKLVDARAVQRMDVGLQDLRDLAEAGDEALAGPGALAVVQQDWLVRAIADLGARALPFARPFRVFDALDPALEWLGFPTDGADARARLPAAGFAGPRAFALGYYPTPLRGEERVSNG